AIGPPLRARVLMSGWSRRDTDRGRQPVAESAYQFRLPGQLEVGLGAHRAIPERALGLGRRVLCVSDRNCVRIPEAAATVDALRAGADTFELFADVPGEPTTDEVERGLAAAGRIEAAVVVGLGGGSVLDTAKAVAAMATNKGSIVDYMGRDRLTARRLPL